MSGHDLGFDFCGCLLTMRSSLPTRSSLGTPDSLQPNELLSGKPFRQEPLFCRAASFGQEAVVLAASCRLRCGLLAAVFRPRSNEDVASGLSWPKASSSPWYPQPGGCVNRGSDLLTKTILLQGPP